MPLQPHQRSGIERKGHSRGNNTPHDQNGVLDLGSGKRLGIEPPLRKHTRTQNNDDAGNGGQAEIENLQGSNKIEHLFRRPGVHSAGQAGDLFGCGRTEPHLQQRHDHLEAYEKPHQPVSLGAHEPDVEGDKQKRQQRIP